MLNAQDTFETGCIQFWGAVISNLTQLQISLGKHRYTENHK